MVFRNYITAFELRHRKRVVLLPQRMTGSVDAVEDRQQAFFLRSVVSHDLFTLDDVDCGSVAPTACRVFTEDRRTPSPTNACRTAWTSAVLLASSPTTTITRRRPERRSGCPRFAPHT